MKYSRVYIEAIGYELPPVVVTSGELEARLQPLYEALRMPAGQLEALTGIAERRWWEPGFVLFIVGANFVAWIAGILVGVGLRSLRRPRLRG